MKIDHGIISEDDISRLAFVDLERQKPLSKESAYLFNPASKHWFQDDIPFRNYKRSESISFEPYSVLFIAALQVVIASTNVSLNLIFVMNGWMTAAVILGIFGMTIFWTVVTISFYERWLQINHPFRFVLTRKLSNTSLFSESLDVIALLSATGFGLLLIGRMVAGQCPSNTTMWTSQNCNNVAVRNSVPIDNILACYLCPVTAQLLLRGIRFKTIILCWIIGIAFVIAAIIFVEGHYHVYTILFSLTFLYIPFEIERFMRISYAQQQELKNQVIRERLREDKKRIDERERLETDLRDLQSVYEKQKMEQEKEAAELECHHLRSLIGNVAHDLKTPIQSISMGIEVLRSEFLSLRKRFSNLDTRDVELNIELSFESLLSNITASCKFMTMGINRSIDFTKASSNIQLVPAMETTDIYDVISVSLECVRTLQSSVLIQFLPLPAGICRYIITDKHWLGENILCVLSNAVKYSNEGVVNINVELVGGLDVKKGLLPESDYFVQINIIDEGIGISEEARERLFQPFKQAQRSTGGTGLGLYSLLKRMEALGGSCGIRSRDDRKQGSIFWFTFPYRWFYYLCPYFCE
jgi:signal transduction histidine kinase